MTFMSYVIITLVHSFWHAICNNSKYEKSFQQKIALSENTRFYFRRDIYSQIQSNFNATQPGQREKKKEKP